MFYYIKSLEQNALCVLLFVCISNFALSQTNLVPNYSFENYSVCPTLSENNCNNWYKPDLGGGAYCNVCATSKKVGVPFNMPTYNSYQYPRTGNAYMSLFYRNAGNSRNYVQVELSDTLRPYHRYYAEYFVNLSNDSRLGCNNQSILFTPNAMYVDTNARPNIYILQANPQITNYDNPIIADTLNWIKVSGIFTAKGGEHFLTLGNFRDNNSTHYVVYQSNGYPGAGYYIDDVSVYDLDSFHLKADAGRDTTIKKGDSVFVGSYTNGIDTLKWLQNGTSVVDTTRPGFWIWPTANTYYVLTQTVGGFTSSDTVYIGVSTLPVKFISFSALLKENKVENVWQTANEINVNSYLIEKSTDGKAFYRIGKLNAENKARNSYAFSDENASEGVSYYRVLALDHDGRRTYSGVQRLAHFNSTNELLIYPNPAQDYVTLGYQHIKQVSIYSAMEKLVYNKPYNDANNVIVNLRNLGKGVYLVKITGTDGKTRSEKLIIQ